VHGRHRLAAHSHSWGAACYARRIARPLVSIFVPTYDGAQFIGQTIEGVLDQTYENFELIVVDDCSSDDTVAVVEGYATKDPRVILLRKNVREGPCKARTDALLRSRGSLLCWLDQDDIWMRTKVQEQVEFMSHCPNVGLVYTYFDAFDSATGKLLDWPDGRRDFEGDVLATLFLVGCFIGSVTTMFRRTVFRGSVPHVRERDFSFGDDYYLWLTIALQWQVERIPKVLAAYRRHASNESSRITSHSNVALRLADLQREFLDDLPIARDRLGDIADIAQARFLILAARFELARAKPFRAVRLTARAMSLDSLTLARTRLGRRIPQLRLF
jgi:teichuronic acid biosynthesis glycosyltransferase TuaG